MSSYKFSSNIWQLETVHGQRDTLGNPARNSSGEEEISVAAEKTGVWNLSSTELEEFGSCLRFSFEMLEGPHLMIKPRVKGHTLRLN